MQCYDQKSSKLVYIVKPHTLGVVWFISCNNILNHCLDEAVVIQQINSNEETTKSHISKETMKNKNNLLPSTTRKKINSILQKTYFS